jgi:hypothetical protein
MYKRDWWTPHVELILNNCPDAGPFFAAVLRSQWNCVIAELQTAGIRKKISVQRHPTRDEPPLGSSLLQQHMVVAEIQAVVVKTNAAVHAFKPPSWIISFVLDAIVQHLGNMSCSYYHLLYPRLQVDIRVVAKAVVSAAANAIFLIHFCNVLSDVPPAITAAGVQRLELVGVMDFWIPSEIVVPATAIRLAPARAARWSAPVALPVDITPPAEDIECG